MLLLSSNHILKYPTGWFYLFIYNLMYLHYSFPYIYLREFHGFNQDGIFCTSLYWAALLPLGNSHQFGITRMNQLETATELNSEARAELFFFFFCVEIKAQTMLTHTKNPQYFMQILFRQGKTKKELDGHDQPKLVAHNLNKLFLFLNFQRFLLPRTEQSLAGKSG